MFPDFSDKEIASQIGIEAVLAMHTGRETTSVKEEPTSLHDAEEDRATQDSGPRSPVGTDRSLNNEPPTGDGPRRQKSTSTRADDDRVRRDSSLEYATDDPTYKAPAVPPSQTSSGRDQEVDEQGFRPKQHRVDPESRSSSRARGSTGGLIPPNSAHRDSARRRSSKGKQVDRSAAWDPSPTRADHSEEEVDLAVRRRYTSTTSGACGSKNAVGG